MGIDYTAFMRDESKAVPCSSCGADLRSGFDKSHDKPQHWGWVAWQVDGRKVTNFALSCVDCRRRQGPMAWLTSNHILDIPLEHATGLRAVTAMFRLLRDFEWDTRTANDLHDAMWSLQTMPTWKGECPDID